MQSGNQYELEVKQGEIVSQEGFFYKVGKFTVFVDDQTIELVFKQGPSHDVVYSVQIDGQEVYQLAHPHYVPEVGGLLPKSKDPVAVDEIDAHLIKQDRLGSTLMAACVQVGIVGDKAYMKHFRDPDVSKEYSYRVVQPKIIIAD